MLAGCRVMTRPESGMMGMWCRGKRMEYLMRWEAGDRLSMLRWCSCVWHEVECARTVRGELEQGQE